MNIFDRVKKRFIKDKGQLQRQLEDGSWQDVSKRGDEGVYRTINLVEGVPVIHKEKTQ